MDKNRLTFAENVSYKVIRKRKLQRCDIRLFLSDDDPLASAASFIEVEGRAVEGKGRTRRALAEGTQLGGIAKKVTVKASVWKATAVSHIRT